MGPNESGDVEVHAFGEGFGRTGSGFGGRSGVGALFSGQCNACGEYGHKHVHCPQKRACCTCGDSIQRADSAPTIWPMARVKAVTT